MDVRFKATAVIGCFSRETARSQMAHLRRNILLGHIDFTLSFI
jgi:hypothetical protein